MIENSSNYLSEKYKAPRSQIHQWRNNGRDWDFILNGGNKGLDVFLQHCNDNMDWNITSIEWMGLVHVLEEIEKNSYVGFIGEPKVPLLPAPESSGSAWQKYKQTLIGKKFSAISIDNIQRASQKVVSQLNKSTDQKLPVRGMVIGNVQSGKTANMAGVISMAEDFGYNFFIVLSGTIDSLRRQTQERLISDLNSSNCSLNLMPLSSLSGHSEIGSRLQDLRLENGETNRYLYVCLKNTSRLKDLLIWLNSDKQNKSKLRIVLIDDEADQAGVNTANMKKDLVSRINKQIKAIVFARNYEYMDSTPYQAMNYIGYTATPYANFLNEANDASLYPCNFILTLNSPEEYIGPQQIFGVDDVNIGLPIVNMIEENEISKINDMGFDALSLPAGLRESINWFICSVACFRFWKLEKPVSMLIHTSQMIMKHDMMAGVVEDYLNYLARNEYYLEEIEKTYYQQTAKLDIQRFLEELVDFPKEQSVVDYPKFWEIVRYINELVGLGTQHILLNEEEETLHYGEGIHLCVDNCKNNYIEENIILRLIYPDKNHEIMKKSPAFIVIGGATLSRGLTLEGLTSSYFIRTTVLADTLMQMGRWFGFRKRYELMPRLWLSNRVYEQFKFLTVLDTDLREELHNMESLGLSPKEYAPRLDTFPSFKALQATSKNKMQTAYEIIQDFSNKKGQTTKFFEEPKIIEDNYQKAFKFVNGLGPIDRNAINNLKNTFCNPSTLIWFDRPFEDVIELIGSLKFPNGQSALISDKDETLKWFKNQKENGYLNNFNVILGSNVSGGNILTFSNDIKIHLPTRRKLKQSNVGEIDLKIISYPNDRLLDIDMSEFTNKQINDVTSSKTMTTIEKRIKFGLADTPLLILYFIDKESGKDLVDTIDRTSLNLSQHLVGYYIYIPYGNGGKNKKNVECNKLIVKLDFLKGDLEDEDENTCP